MKFGKAQAQSFLPLEIFKSSMAAYSFKNSNQRLIDRSDILKKNRERR